MAHRHLCEADLTGKGGDALLVVGIAVGMHEHDRHRTDAGFERSRKLPPHRSKIRLALHRAVRAHAFVHFDNAFVDHFRLDDVTGKNLRPRLITDPKRVAETLADEQQCPLALALEQRIGCNGRAHLYGRDCAASNRLTRFDTKQVANALHRRIAVGFGIVGEQLVRNERAVGAAPDHVGKRASPIDPKLPAAVPLHRRAPGLPRCFIEVRPCEAKRRDSREPQPFRPRSRYQRSAPG